MARVPSILRSEVNGLASLLLAGTVILAIAWLGRQIQKAMIGEPLDVPKYLLLAAAIPMHWIVLLTPMPHKPIAIVAILTIYHNLQYHRLVWFHNKKYSAGDKRVAANRSVSSAVVDGSSRNLTEELRRFDQRQKYGAAELISRRLVYYIAFGIIFGLIYQGPRQFLGYVSLKNASSGLTEPSFPLQLCISFLWGYALIHYYLDSKIWRVRRDPTVGKALNMS
jgi:hypothetical protein